MISKLLKSVGCKNCFVLKFCPKTSLDLISCLDGLESLLKMILPNIEYCHGFHSLNFKMPMKRKF